MKQDERAPFDRPLHRARLSTYPPGEFVGQEGFMRASEILALALVADGINGGERRHRVLEHRADGPAADLRHLAVGQPE